MRSESSIKTVITAVISNILTILIGFIAQAIFVKTLGTEYLGINGLFNNILSMLAIVELGFGSAIIVNLYKPVAKGDNEKVKSLLSFYKTIYRIIAIIIAILGIILLPFLKYIIGEVNIEENIQLIFFLYLVDIVVSYLLTYKRSILYANQKSYITNIVHMGYVIIMNFMQIMYLLYYSNLLGYLIIKIVCRALENIILTVIANKKYPYTCEKDIKPINKRLKRSILIRVKGLLFHKIGGFIVQGTDNIIISMTPSLGIVTVGLYSNYSMIINALNNLFGQIFSSLTASIGNLLVENNKEKNYNIFKSTLLMNSWIYSFAAISMYFISEPFINIWLGKEYVLSNIVVFILVINFYVNGMRKTYSTFKEAAGIFFEDRYVPIIEAFVNIVVSIVLANLIGLPGVFIGTIASNMVLFLFSFPKFVYKKVLHREIGDYIKENLQYVILFAISFGVTYVCTRFININNNLLKILVNGIICVVIPNSIYFIAKFRTDEFKYYIDMFLNMKNKFGKRKMEKKAV